MRYIDASALKLLYCHRLFYLKVIQGYKEKELRNDIVAGSAIHRFLRDRHTLGISQAALEAMVWFGQQPAILAKEYLTPKYVYEACLKISSYESPYRVIGHGTKDALVEKSFQVPLSPNWTLVGTIDEFCEDSKGNLVYDDYKTTGLGYTSDKRIEFLNSFTRSVQFLCYEWAYRIHQEAWPNGDLAKRKFLGGVTTAVFLNPKEVSIDTSGIISFTQDQLDYFGESLAKLVANIPGDDPTGLINNSCVSGRNKPCPMLDYCKYEKNESYLKANYNQEEYKPLDWY